MNTIFGASSDGITLLHPDLQTNETFMGLGAAVDPKGSLRRFEPSQTPSLSSTSYILTRSNAMAPAASAEFIFAMDEDWAIVVDGAILNFPELCQDLHAQGFIVNRNNESQVLLSAFRAWGWKSLERLVGQFALAFFDMRSQMIGLARDEFGLKTVYYHVSSGGVCFSSALPTLLAWRHIDRSANPNALYSFLRHGTTPSSTETMYRGIGQVPPGHLMLVDMQTHQATTPTPFKKWGLPAPVDVSFDEAAKTVRELFLESVSMHLRGNPAIGASLSGGTDSSAIVASIRTIAGDNYPLHTFSYIAQGESSINEEPWIDLVNTSEDCIPHKVTPTSDEFVRDLEPLTQALGEPLSGTSQYVQWRVFGMVRDAGLTTVLDGVGGDGVTVGHDYYLADYLVELLRSKKIYESTELLIGILRNPQLRKSKRIMRQAVSYLPAPVQEVVRRVAKQTPYPDWLNAHWFSGAGVDAGNFHPPKGSRLLHRHMLEVLQVDRHARYAERAAIATGTESRLPFYYRPLAEFLMSLPSDYFFSKSGDNRRVFRAAMDGIIPRTVLLRRDKLAFQPPENRWMAEHREWANNTLVLGREVGLPIGPLEIPEGLLSDSTSRTNLVRCVAASIWATTFNIRFD